MIFNQFKICLFIIVSFSGLLLFCKPSLHFSKNNAFSHILRKSKSHCLPISTRRFFKEAFKWNPSRLYTERDFYKKSGVRHVTGTGSGLLGGIPRVVVQISALT